MKQVLAAKLDGDRYAGKRWELVNPWSSEKDGKYWRGWSRAKGYAQAGRVEAALPYTAAMRYGGGVLSHRRFRPASRSPNARDRAGPILESTHGAYACISIVLV